MTVLVKYSNHLKSIAKPKLGTGCRPRIHSGRIKNIENEEIILPKMIVLVKEGNNLKSIAKPR